MAGMLICIDGIDCAGKDTQSKMLVKALEQEGHKVSLHSYPDYGSRYGKIIREYLDKKITLNVNELFLMFVADMVKDKENVVAELGRGEVVVMDRYFIDTIAYQSAGGFNYEFGKKIEEFIGLPQPNLVIYLDIPAHVALERKLKQKELPDRNEENTAYLEKVRKVYDRLFEERYTTGKWLKIDGTKGIEEVHGIIAKAVLDGILDARKAPSK